MTQFTSPFGEVFVVADGMGGQQGGSTAATLVVTLLQKWLTQLSPSMPWDEALRQATQNTNYEIYTAGSSGDPAYAGMGSTVVMALLNGSSLVVAHIGDSRAYLLRQGQMTRLTRDHTSVQRLVDEGLLSEHDAKDHPDASVLSRAMGQKPNVELEIASPIPLVPGDGVILCTDGLWAYVDQEAILAALQQYRTPAETVEALVHLALQAGGEDNVTVQYIQWQPDAFVPPPIASPRTTQVYEPAVKRSLRRIGNLRSAGKWQYFVAGIAFVALSFLAVISVRTYLDKRNVKVPPVAEKRGPAQTPAAARPAVIENQGRTPTTPPGAQPSSPPQGTPPGGPPPNTTRNTQVLPPAPLPAPSEHPAAGGTKDDGNRVEPFDPSSPPPTGGTAAAPAENSNPGTVPGAVPPAPRTAPNRETPPPLAGVARMKAAVLYSGPATSEQKYGEIKRLVQRYAEEISGDIRGTIAPVELIAVDRKEERRIPEKTRVLCVPERKDQAALIAKQLGAKVSTDVPSELKHYMNRFQILVLAGKGKK